ncbi:hypothetical protein H0R92_10765 [Treponema sp. OMZ 840]|uniref:hypothetical protein n=1 Tax=Treponema sp. OMZ 840 TaxID=244313 RepID=UPI003D923354
MKRYIYICITLSALFYNLFADVDIKSGKLRLVIEDYDGTVFLYRRNNQGDYISLLDSKRYTVNSGFYVLSGKNVQKLTRSGGMHIKSSETGSGAQLVFTLKNKYSCTVLFSFFASDEKENDSVRIDVALENIGEERRLTGLRVFFDTWLGETSGKHFSTAVRDSIDSECFFTDMSRDRWIQSSNGDVSMRLLLWGEGITKIQTLAIANKDVLGIPVWAPRFVPERKFDSITSYNNSALSVFWEPKYLQPHEKTDIRFYIATDAKQSALPELQALQSPTGASADSLLYASPSSGKDPALEDAYIRFLIARVRELEANPDSVDREEILRLNAEIDAVLLRSGR